MAGSGSGLRQTRLGIATAWYNGSMSTEIAITPNVTYIATHVVYNYMHVAPNPNPNSATCQLSTGSILKHAWIVHRHLRNCKQSEGPLHSVRRLLDDSGKH